jgi:hypothetical protein
VRDANGELLSVTVTPNVFVPCVVGVPDKRPEALKARPVGSVDTDATDHWYGGVPPVAAN